MLSAMTLNSQPCGALATLLVGKPTLEGKETRLIVDRCYVVWDDYGIEGNGACRV